MKINHLLIFIIVVFTLSCSTTKDSHRGKRKRKKRIPENSRIEKAYKYKRQTPLGKKYPDYQPFRRDMHSKSYYRSPLKPRLKRTKKFVIVANFLDKTDKFFEGLSTSASNMPKNMNLSSLITGVIYNIDFSSTGSNIGLFKETKYFCQVSMGIRAIDINLQRIIFEENIQGTSDKSVSHFFSIENKKDYKMAVVEQAIKNAYDKISWKIIPKIEKIGWKGRIAKVDRNKIYINGGQRTGITAGDILLVSDLGEVIFNPETGRPLGRAPGNIKGTIRIVDFFGKDGAIAVINSGA